MYMMLLELVKAIPGYNRELQRLYERLDGVQSMVSISAPPTDKIRVSGGSTSPDKIGQCVALSDDIRKRIDLLQSQIKAIVHILRRHLDGTLLQVTWLYYVSGCSTYDIAEKIGLSQSTVSRKKRQAERILADIQI